MISVCGFLSCNHIQPAPLIDKSLPFQCFSNGMKQPFSPQFVVGGNGWLSGCGARCFASFYVNGRASVYCATKNVCCFWASGMLGAMPYNYQNYLDYII